MTSIEQYGCAFAGDKGFLTVKGLTTGASREEYEYPIPLDDAKAMLSLCEGSIVEKNRRLIRHKGRTWEIDEFLGDNAGLVIAEIELETEQQKIDLPEWVGSEVTDDVRYFNANLSINPYTRW